MCRWFWMAGAWSLRGSSFSEGKKVQGIAGPQGPMM